MHIPAAKKGLSEPLCMKKILLVEDEMHVVSFIKKGLTEEGFDVTVAFVSTSGNTPCPSLG